MKRRNFIKNGILGFLGLVAAPSLLKGSSSVAEIEAPAGKPNPDEWNNDEINIAWIGHATVLINFYGTWIITDPVLFQRVGIYFLGTTWGPSRYTKPALMIDEIPKPDLILLSHAHMDHTDYLTLKTFAKMYPDEIDVVCAYQTKDVIDELNWKSLTEIDWNDEISIAGLNIRAHEVKHFGWRYPWEDDRSRGNFRNGRSYNSYLIEKNGSKVLFGGDTAFTDSFNKLKDENIDIAIMPIGAYRPWRRVHCNPEEALIMAERMNAKHFIPIHCNTFQQGREPREEPLNWLTGSAGNYTFNLGIDNIGKTLSV